MANLYSGGMARRDDPDVPPASVFDRLTRRLPGLRGGAGPMDPYRAAERQAILDANMADDIPIVPAPLGRPRSKPAPAAAELSPATAELSPAAAELSPAAADSAPAAAELTPASLEAAVAIPLLASPPDETASPAGPSEQQPATPVAPGAVEPGPEPAASTAPHPTPGTDSSALSQRVQEILESAARPTEDTAPSPPPDAPEEVLSTSPEIGPDGASARRRRPGVTAPEEMLQPSASVAPAADDFFDGLVRRVEGNR